MVPAAHDSPTTSDSGSDYDFKIMYEKIMYGLWDYLDK